jgi:hypothetical protein
MTDGCDPGPQPWQKKLSEEKKEKKPVRRPNHHSVLLKTVVNMRFRPIEAPSQIAAIEKILDEANDMFWDLFKKHRRAAVVLGSNEPAKVLPIDGTVMKDGKPLELIYTEWAEDHQCALVDDEAGELDDFANSQWYDLDGGHWYPSVEVPRHDKNCFMEMAHVALSRHRHEIGDLLDISDEELDRLEANLNRYLGGPNYGKEKEGQKEEGREEKEGGEEKEEKETPSP